MTGSGTPPSVEFHGHTNAQFGDGTTQINHTTSYTITPSRLDRAADDLALQVWKWWKKEAYQRRLESPPPLPLRWRLSSESLTGPVAAATAEGTERRFGPLPGFPVVTEDRLRGGGGLDELHGVYGGLASGRILVVGTAGAGKTSAAVLLLLRVLRHRHDTELPHEKARVPVPVLISLNDWEPEEEQPIDWAARMLHRRHPHKYVRELLETGRVALFVDGLDEVAEKVRGEAVSAPAALPCRVLMVARTNEIKAIANEAQLSDVVALELLTVRRPDAVAYLRAQVSRPSPAWQKLTHRLENDGRSPLAKALARPLTLGLLGEQHSDTALVEEILDLDEAGKITQRLLDRAVTFAYTRRKGGERPRYSPEQAERTLRYIARRLTDDDTHDLRWWQIPCWGNPGARARVTWTLVMPFYVALSGYMAFAWPGPLSAVVASAVLIGAGIDVALRLWQLNRPQELQSAGWRDVFPRGAITRGVTTWSGCVVTTWIFRSFIGSSASMWQQQWWQYCLYAVPFSLGTAMYSGSGAILIGRTMLAPHKAFPYEVPPEEFLPPPTAETRAIDPIDVWRHHLWLRLPLGLMVGVTIGLFWGAWCAPILGPWGGVFIGVATAVGPALRCGVVPNLAVATMLTSVQLALREGTPLCLMAFLQDAHERGLLRAAGPVYQFRHARLRDHLAGPRK
ncbi:hypothetical protein AB0H51_28850 [Streptomyces griseoluteus]|uniref:NACHT domain-containing protein n=1 Tax=Streptomyces griseoluteus TaxID=29306 RepID=UPI0033E543CE